MIIGTLYPVSADGISELEGKIETLDFQASIRLAAVKSRASANHPSHRVVTRSASGGVAQIGSAWLKTANKAEHAGKPFLTLTLDDPSFPRALHATAFKRTDEDVWNVVWKRKEAA